VDDEAFLARLKPLYAADVLDGIGKMLKVIRGREVDDESNAVGGVDEAIEDEDVFALENPTLTTEEHIERFKRPYLDRLYDLSAFVGEIKQRFSQWYNLRSERNGPLWEDRFKSVLVQGEPGVLATVAAYIDLNAVRAGIVQDPREWRWCGYAEALKGRGIARNGVYEVLGERGTTRRDGEAWKNVHRRYRQLLMEEGRQLRDEESRVVRKGLTPEEFEAEEARDFELPAPALLRHRVRYFVDGLALGSATFVESVFEKNRVRMGVKRTCGARVPKAEMGGLRTLRDLRR
jgi:putative transposase